MPSLPDPRPQPRVAPQWSPSVAGSAQKRPHSSSPGAHTPSGHRCPELESKPPSPEPTSGPTSLEEPSARASVEGAAPPPSFEPASLPAASGRGRPPSSPPSRRDASPPPSLEASRGPAAPASVLLPSRAASRPERPPAFEVAPSGLAVPTGRHTPAAHRAPPGQSPACAQRAPHTAGDPASAQASPRSFAGKHVALGPNTEHAAPSEHVDVHVPHTHDRSPEQPELSLHARSQLVFPSLLPPDSHPSAQPSVRIETSTPFRTQWLVTLRRPRLLGRPLHRPYAIPPGVPGIARSKTSDASWIRPRPDGPG